MLPSATPGGYMTLPLLIPFGPKHLARALAERKHLALGEDFAATMTALAPFAQRDH